MGFFTILVNTRNSSAKITRCIESLLSQNFHDFQVIINEDASEDDTYSLAEGAIGMDSRFSLKRNPSRKGAVVNTFDTLRGIKGQDTVVLVLDGDDYLFNEESLRIIYQVYRQDPLVEATNWGFVTRRRKEDGSEYLSNSYRIDNYPWDTNKGWPHAHCRTFKNHLFDYLGEDYFKAYTGEFPITSVDSIVHMAMVRLAKKVVSLSKPVYVWDITGDTEHDFDYSQEPHNPITDFYRSYSREYTDKILNKNRSKGLDISFNILGDNKNPLGNKVVFFIGYRNQPSKIIECLKSLFASIDQSKYLQKEDIGVLVIDDASTDTSFDKVLEMVGQEGLDSILIKNKDRKMYSCNLYHAVNLLCNNDDSVIVELNGDDRLIPESNPIDVIWEEYLKGAKRTYGNFRMITDGELDSHSRNTIALKERVLSTGRDIAGYSYWLHPKTYKRGLFMRIPLHYFFEKGSCNWIKGNDDLLLGKVMSSLVSKEESHQIVKEIYEFDVGNGTSRFCSKDFKQYSRDSLYDYWEHLREFDGLAFNNKFIRPIRVSLAPEVSMPLSDYTVEGYDNIKGKKYIAVVFVYNYGEKLARCLKSISKMIEGRDDCGVLLYNDAATEFTQEELLSKALSLGIAPMVITNKINKGKAHNLYILARKVLFDRESILLFIDGDDFVLSEERSPLSILDSYYKDPEVEATFGSFVMPDDTELSRDIQKFFGFCTCPISKEDIDEDLKFPAWTHLKTCKSHLLNKVEEDFFMDTESFSFLKTADDNFIFPRCVYLAQKYAYVKEYLYGYDTLGNTSHWETNFVNGYASIQKARGLLFKQERSLRDRVGYTRSEKAKSLTSFVKGLSINKGHPSGYQEHTPSGQITEVGLAQ